MTGMTVQSTNNVFNFSTFELKVLGKRLLAIIIVIIAIAQLVMVTLRYLAITLCSIYTRIILYLVLLYMNSPHLEIDLKWFSFENKLYIPTPQEHKRNRLEMACNYHVICDLVADKMLITIIFFGDPITRQFAKIQTRSPYKDPK